MYCTSCLAREAKSLVSTSPKLRANKLDIEKPDSCSGRAATETPADLVQVKNEYDTLVTRASALLVALLPPLHPWQVHACISKMMLWPLAGGAAAWLPHKKLLMPTHHNSRYSPAQKCLPDSCRSTCFQQLPRHFVIVLDTSLCFLLLRAPPFVIDVLWQSRRNFVAL